jgi:hypothetical protein
MQRMLQEPSLPLERVRQEVAWETYHRLALLRAEVNQSPHRVASGWKWVVSAGDFQLHIAQGMSRG